MLLRGLCRGEYGENGYRQQYATSSDLFQPVWILKRKRGNSNDLDQLDDKGWIHDPKNKAKSVGVTEEGKRVVEDISGGRASAP